MIYESKVLGLIWTLPLQFWHWVLFCVFTQIKKFLCSSQSIKTFILSNNLSNPTNNSEQFPTIYLPIFCQFIIFYKVFLNCSLFKLWPLTSLSTSMEWICIAELSLLFFQDRTIRLGQLKSLDLSYNSLTEMPDMVENIPHLQDLRMSHNRISRITGK